MKIIYLSNFFNHHQKFLSDVLFEHLGDGYHFVETCEIPKAQKELGYHSYKVPYILKYNGQTKGEIDKMIMDADIVICGAAPLNMIKRRVRAGKIVIRNSERRYKSFLRYLKWPIYTYQSLFFNKGFLLAASAFAPRDYVLSGMKLSKCYRWGYFPEVKLYDNVEEIFERKRKNRGLKQLDVSILWVARLIGLKHPEAAIEVANMLEKEGIRYELNIIGAGPLEDNVNELIKTNGLSSNVHLLGPVPPERVRDYMEESDIFLFTSDQNEGWGAVLNESMNSACAVVAGHMIGSVPYLIKNHENSLIFRSEDWDDLCDKVKHLALNPKEREVMGLNAYKTLVNTWNPRVAGENLIKLCESLLKGEGTPIEDGPCSRAKILCSNWMKK